MAKLQVRKSVTAGVMAAFAGLSGAQTAAPAPDTDYTPSDADMKRAIVAAADIIQAGTDKYCDPAVDGDKSKGEMTNADIGKLIRASAETKDMPLTAAYAMVVAAAENDFTLCVDKRMKDIGSASPPQQFTQLLTENRPFSLSYPFITTIGITPVKSAAGEQADATGILRSISVLGRALGMAQSSPQALFMPLMMLQSNDPAGGATAFIAPSALSPLFPTPPLKQDSPSSAPRPSGTRYNI